MLKSLKDLFIYKKPDPAEQEFELLEDIQESSLWDQYRGNEKNLKNQNSSNDQTNGSQAPQDQGQNSQNTNPQQNNQNQQDVREKLLQIMKDSQNTSNKNNEQSGQQNDVLDLGSDEGSTDNQSGSQASNQANNQVENQAKNQTDNQTNNQTNNQADNQGSTFSGNSTETETGSGQETPGKSGQETQDSAGQSGDNNENNTANQEKEADGNQSSNEQGSPAKNNEGANNEKTNSEGTKDSKSIKNMGICYKTPLTLEELIKNNKSKKKHKQNGSNKVAKSKTKNDETEDPENKNNGGQGENKECGSENSGNKGRKKGKSASSMEDNEVCLSTSLEENIKYLKKIFHVPLNQDVIIREFNVARKIPACVVFIDGMIDKSIVIQFTLPQLMDVHPFSEFDGGCPMDYIEKNVISINQIIRMKKFGEIVPQILSGLTALFIDGCDEALVMESRGFETRSINPPATETVVQGAQEGFTENLRTNITLIRRIVKNENLITEFDSISRSNNFLSALLYVKGLVNPKIIDEIKRRIKSIDVDYISGSCMMEQLIEDHSNMLFPQVLTTERPDRVASFLLEGKAVLICEGSPFALAMPITFFDLFHTSEDSNLRWQYGTFLRIVRLAGLLLGLLLPGLYTALILYHQEMIPTGLLSSIVSSRKAVPFPTIVEILLLEFSFELIREGGIRVPGVTGNTLGIIGALILGQAAVEAGLVSPILIIIVAITGLGTFAIPNYSLALAVRIVRFSMIILGQMAGFYGVSAGVTILCANALGMKSFGVPYFSPIAPATRSNKDKIIRGPLYTQTQRPDYLNTQNRQRMGDNPRGWISGEEGGGMGNAQGR